MASWPPTGLPVPRWTRRCRPPVGCWRQPGNTRNSASRASTTSSPSRARRWRRFVAPMDSHRSWRRSSRRRLACRACSTRAAPPSTSWRIRARRWPLRSRSGLRLATTPGRSTPSPGSCRAPPTRRPFSRSPRSSTRRSSAYQDGNAILTTFVATGRPQLPTPPGVYRIFARYSPYKMISPWPYGSPWWYPSSWTSFAMEFAAGGYFIHDAPWRSWYGPGANLYNGTHGCVNVPYSPMATLWNWAPNGTTVVVQY
ncbi:MAG: L,D-transpeptidase [Chloroflexi bacterium]|nr:MAG: L,D-transpeptidase [Chloroflexota bacterium]